MRARGADLSIDTILEITLSLPEIASGGGGGGGGSGGGNGGEMIVKSWPRAEGRH